MSHYWRPLDLGCPFCLGPEDSPFPPGFGLHSPPQAHSFSLPCLAYEAAAVVVVVGPLIGFQPFMLMDLLFHLFVTAVSVYTNGTVFAANTNITFVAITEETIPLEFAWYFGENPPVMTTSRSIRRRLSVPQWSVYIVFSVDAANTQD